MNSSDKQQVLHIKKYANRRYYDTTRSRHLTLQEIYDAVQSGCDVSVTDSQSGADITNLVLIQIVLEKDPPKLDLFPSAVLHLMVRSNYQALRSTLERFFRPFMDMMSAGQRQFDAYLRQAMSGSGVSPLDWPNQMMAAFSPATASPPRSGHDASQPGEPQEQERPEDERPDDAPLEDLRRQIAELTRRVEQLGSAGRDPVP
jgi:polyhydroxyalkanoate synthesis repressor PhaR